MRKSPMWTGSWLAYGEILRNSVIGAARFLNKATMRPHVVRIATTGKGVTIEIMGKGVTTEIMGRSVTTGNTGQGVTSMTTNEGKIDCPCVASACDSSGYAAAISELLFMLRPAPWPNPSPARFSYQGSSPTLLRARERGSHELKGLPGRWDLFAASA